MKQNLFKKFLGFSIGSVLALIIGLISTPIITRNISPEQYGRGSIFTLVSSLISVIILMGCEQAYVRFFYEEVEESRPKLLKECLKIPIISFLILCIIFLIFKDPLSNILFDKNDILLSLAILQGLILAINNFSLLTIRMQQKGKLYSILTVGLKLMYVVFVMTLMNGFNKDYRTIVISTIMSNVIITTVAIYSQRKYWFNSDKNIKLKNNVRDIFTLAWPLVFTFMINWLFQSMDKLSLKYFSGYYEVGLYSQAASLVGTIAVLQTAFTTFWTPVAYEHYESEPNNRKFYSYIFEIISLVFILLAMLILMFKELFLILLGKQYREAIFIIPFLLFMPIMYTMSEVSQVGINFKKKSRVHLLISAVACLTNLILNFILVPKIGARGAAIATGISYMVFFVLRTYFGQKYYSFNIKITRILTMIIILFTYALICTYIKITLINIICGIVGIIILVSINKKIIYNMIKKVNIFIFTKRDKV